MPEAFFRSLQQLLSSRAAPIVFVPKQSGRVALELQPIGSVVFGKQQLLRSNCEAPAVRGAYVLLLHKNHTAPNLPRC